MKVSDSLNLLGFVSGIFVLENITSSALLCSPFALKYAIL